MFTHNKPPISAGNFYINYANDQFLVSCNKSAFKQEFRDNIPAIFQQEKGRDNLFIAVFDRKKPETTNTFIEALATMIDGEEIQQRLQAYVNNEVRQSMQRKF